MSKLQELAGIQVKESHGKKRTGVVLGVNMAKQTLRIRLDGGDDRVHVPFDKWAAGDWKPVN